MRQKRTPSQKAESHSADARPQGSRSGERTLRPCRPPGAELEDLDNAAGAYNPEGWSRRDQEPLVIRAKSTLPESARYHSLDKAARL